MHAMDRTYYGMETVSFRKCREPPGSFSVLRTKPAERLGTKGKFWYSSITGNVLSTVLVSVCAGRTASL